MRRLCSWCGLDMGEKEPFDDTRISHGICPDCRDKLLAPEPVGLGVYLRITKDRKIVGIVDNADRLSINAINAIMRISAEHGRDVAIMGC